VEELLINKIYNENCLDTMSKMRDNFVDLTLTSPPYNMMTQVKYNKYIKRVSNKHKSNKYIDFNDGLGIDEFYETHFEILKELLRVSKTVLYNFQIVSGSKEAFFKLMGDYNKSIKDIIIWDKCRFLPASREKILNAGYEMILVMEGDNHLGRTVQNATFDRCEIDNILRVPRKKVVIDGVKHNAVFPEELCEILINGFSEEGGLVYDPFMGTGTVAKVSKDNNRNYIGSEISKEYCEIIEKRMR
jgi:site-specific DNA-methyltransferase (adenine-specific)/modification methylase